MHTDRLIFESRPPAGSCAPSRTVPPTRRRWSPPAEAAGLPLLPFTAELLGLPVDAAAGRHAHRRAARSSRPAAPPTAGSASPRTGWSPTRPGGCC